MKKLVVLLAIAAVVMVATDAQAFKITTHDGGADAEIRESGQYSNRGDSTEIASRVAANRNSMIYLKFDVSTMTAADLAGDITVRTCHRNNNLSAGRISDDDFGMVGWDYYVLDPTETGANWAEDEIAPDTDVVSGVVAAPGYTYDGDYTTRGIDIPPMTALGTKDYSLADINPLDGLIDVGSAFDFTLAAGSALHTAITTAQGLSEQYVTVAMRVNIDYYNNPLDPADPLNTPANWTNFNYLFIPKEYDDLSDKTNANSPFGHLFQSDNDWAFSPQLTNEPHIPEPATMALLGFGGLALLRKRK